MTLDAFLAHCDTAKYDLEEVSAADAAHIAQSVRALREAIALYAAALDVTRTMLLDMIPICSKAITREPLTGEDLAVIAQFSPTAAVAQSAVVLARKHLDRVQ